MPLKKITESNLWNWLSKAKPVLKESLQLIRIENSVETGTPDVFGIYAGEPAFWVELKAWDLPENPGTHFKHKVTPDQISWIHKNALAGGHSGVLIQLGSGADKILLFVPGFRILTLQQQYISVEELKKNALDFTDYTQVEIIYALSSQLKKAKV